MSSVWEKVNTSGFADLAEQVKGLLQIGLAEILKLETERSKTLVEMVNVCRDKGEGLVE